MLALIPSRMTSRRLPGKALIDLAGTPLLARVVARVGEARLVDEVVVATSTDPSDDPIVAFCESARIEYTRGPLKDAAGRLLGAARHRGAEAFVRVSGDSPLIDPELIDRGVAAFRSAASDLVTNVFPRTFPPGQSVEVIATGALAHLHSILMDPIHLEHVTSGFYADPIRWKIINLESGVEGPHRSVTVDIPEDVPRVESIIRRLGAGPSGWFEVRSAAMMES